MDEKPVHDKPMEGRNNSKEPGGTDAQDRTKARITTQPVLAAPHEVVNANVILAKVPPDALGLFIMNSCDLVIVEQAEKVTLGRNVDGTEPPVFIDLTPHGGGPLGVSRRHAAILISQGMYLLQDLGSTNGTWLNEQRLPPHTPRTLNSGDLIRLGQVRIHVAFHGSKQGQDSGDPAATE